MATSCQSFAAAFKANMDALHLPTPVSLFTSAQTALAVLQAMLNPLKQLGEEATIAELAGATTGLEKLAVVGGFMAVGYTGAVIGSIIVASGGPLACDGTNRVEAMRVLQLWAATAGVVLPPLMVRFIIQYPEVLRPGPHSIAFGYRIRAPKGKAA